MLHGLIGGETQKRRKNGRSSLPGAPRRLDEFDGWQESGLRGLLVTFLGLFDVSHEPALLVVEARPPELRERVRLMEAAVLVQAEVLAARTACSLADGGPRGRRAPSCDAEVQAEARPLAASRGRSGGPM